MFVISAYLTVAEGVNTGWEGVSLLRKIYFRLITLSK